MRGWERVDGEGAKAFECFKIYRDLGSERSLRKVAGMVYGEEKAESNLRTLKRWSSQFDWQDRVAAHEARDAMIARDAVEEYLRVKAEDHGAREAALREKGLQARERALDKALTMFAWPLSEQRRVESGIDGDIVYQFMPAKWSMGTAVTFYQMATSSAPPADAPADELEFDFDDWDEADMIQFLRLSERLTTKRKPDAS